MSTTSVIQCLRSAVLLREHEDLTDRQLLDSLINRQDHVAIEVLLHRHGSMVWGVCKRILGNHHDAEDAFQATFLLLVQKATSIACRDRVGNWLYGVARQTALNAMATRDKRKRRETQQVQIPEPPVMDTNLWDELVPLLDQELGLLPVNYREVIVLCDLEGKTRQEVASSLGCPEGTVASRLARARTLLAKRLSRHGLAISGPLLATLITQNAGASAPGSVLFCTTKATALVLSGHAANLGAISPSVIALTESTVRTMLRNRLLVKLRNATVVCATVAAFSLSAFAPAQLPAAAGPEEDQSLPVVVFPLLERTPARAEEPEPITLKGHTSAVCSVCFSPDGKRLITGGGVLARGVGGGGAPGGVIPPPSGEVKVWDAEKGTEILALNAHTARVFCVCFSPDGKRIASVGADQTLRIWDAEKGQELFALKGQTRSSGSVCFSPDGKRIASLSTEHVKVFDAENGQELLTLTAPVKPNGSVCFSPDGKRIASVYPWTSQGKLAPGEIKVWDAEKGKELLTLKPLSDGKSSGTGSICFSPDGKRIASGSMDQKVRVWDVETGQELMALKGHTANIGSVCFSPNGKRLASAGWDKTVKVWDAEKGQELLTLKGHTATVTSVCFSPDGKRLASASTDQTVKVWSLDKEK